MAIEIKKETEKVNISITNGHLEALNKVVKAYGLKSEKEAISFMLAITSQANGKPIEIGDDKYLPSESLKVEK